MIAATVFLRAVLIHYIRRWTLRAVRWARRASRALARPRHPRDNKKSTSVNAAAFNNASWYRSITYRQSYQPRASWWSYNGRSVLHRCTRLRLLYLKCDRYTFCGDSRLSLKLNERETEGEFVQGNIAGSVIKNRAGDFHLRKTNASSYKRSVSVYDWFLNLDSVRLQS